MYICVCHAVTESDIDGAIASGCCSLRQLREELGVGATCGRCTRCARDTLKESLQAHPACKPAALQLAAA